MADVENTENTGVATVTNEEPLETAMKEIADPPEGSVDDGIESASRKSSVSSIASADAGATQSVQEVEVHAEPRSVDDDHSSNGEAGGEDEAAKDYINQDSAVQITVTEVADNERKSISGSEAGEVEEPVEDSEPEVKVQEEEVIEEQDIPKDEANEERSDDSCSCGGEPIEEDTSNHAEINAQEDEEIAGQVQEVVPPVEIPVPAVRQKSFPLEEAKADPQPEFMSVKLRTRQWEKESGASNVDVLRSIADEDGASEEDQARVKKLLTWAKSSRKAKTETMKVREKEKVKVMQTAVDPNAVQMVIEEKSSTKDGVLRISSVKGRKFEVSNAVPNQFVVRKTSLIQPMSETIVTKDWITNAIKIYEGKVDVSVEAMDFKENGGLYEATIKAKVGGDSKEYNWIIRGSPKPNVDYKPKDKEAFMVSDLGRKVNDFVAKMKKVQTRVSVPFRPVIYADAQYAIFDHLKSYKTFRDDTGFDLEHMKVALKGLAKLHGMTYAYFNKSGDDVKAFSDVLKLVVDRHYQPWAAKEDILRKKQELVRKFEFVMQTISATDEEGERLAAAARTKFGGSNGGDRLYDIFKDANRSSSHFSVLCHGALTPNNVHFLYNDEKRPVDVKFTGFTNAVYAHAVTDLQSFFGISMGPKLEEQAEFLLRFVYYETMVKTLLSLAINPEVTTIISFEQLRKDFKTKEVYGCLSGAMYLVGMPELLGGPGGGGASGGADQPMRRAPGKRVFQSKIVGGQIGSMDQKIYDSSSPALRAKELIRRALNATEARR